jgi:tRNA (guanine37-N1)-methyltransferase
MVLVETVIRLIPGALGNEESSNEDSFQSGLLDGPRYTRPRNYQGLRIPNILISGDHSKVKDWKRREVLRRTLLKRPDLLNNTRLTDDDLRQLKKMKTRSTD